MNDSALSALIPLILIALWFGVWAFWNWVRTRQRTTLLERSLLWPEVQGAVKSAAVVWAHVEINYEYDLPGSRQGGVYKVCLPMVTFRGLQGASRLNQASKSIIAQFAPGQKVLIRYNPRNPFESVLVDKGEV
jgi:hypothetical protein